MEKVIEINGTRYVREDTIKAVPSGDRVVVIADRGFIYCGNAEYSGDGGWLTLTDAANVRKWATGGIGGLLSDPVSAGATIDPVAYPVKVPVAAVLQIVNVPEQWGRQ